MNSGNHPLIDVGLALRYLREKRHLVQQDVAERLGVNKASVSRLERPGANPTIHSVGNYLRVLGASARDLFEALATLSGVNGSESDGEAAATQDRGEPAEETSGSWDEASTVAATAPDVTHLLRQFQGEESVPSPPEPENATLLIEFYRRRFVELHERVALLEARLRER